MGDVILIEGLKGGLNNMSQKNDMIQKTEPTKWPEATIKQSMSTDSDNQMSNNSSKEAEPSTTNGSGGKKEDNADAAQTEARGDSAKGKGPNRITNKLREFRIEQMMSKAELARKAGLSVLTIDRIEKGYGCRMDTKRKILKALGLKLSDRRKLFQEE